MSEDSESREAREKRLEKAMGFKAREGDESEEMAHGAGHGAEFSVPAAPGETGVVDEGADVNARGAGAGEEIGEEAKASSAVEGTVQRVLKELHGEMRAVRDAVGEQGEALKGIAERSQGTGDIMGAFERVAEEVRAYTADRNLRNSLSSGPLRWAGVAALAVGAPALILAGAFVGQRWEVLPLEDATGGWRGHVWEYYGGEIVGCVQKAYRDGSSFECVVNVRDSVDRVRRAATGR